MKKNKIIFWLATGFIFLFEGVMPALTSNTQLAIDGIRHLGYPDYFRIMLTIFKIVGVLVLVIPAVPARIKEWAYAGFFILATGVVASHVAAGSPFGEVFPGILLTALTVLSWWLRPANRKLAAANS